MEYFSPAAGRDSESRGNWCFARLPCPGDI